MKGEEIKCILSKDAEVVNLADIHKDTIGKIDILHEQNDRSILINTLILKTGLEKLFVFLSAVGITRDDVVFHRVYWSNIFRGICIFIDDPRRHELKWSPTYYFGSKSDDYTIRILNCIKKIQEIYSIDNKNVCIISSSNGGFAAIRLSSLIPNSTCLALCPVLAIKTRKELVDEFQKRMDVNLQDKDLMDRVDLVRSTALTDNSSKIYIYSNIESKIDRAQMDYFFSSLDRPFVEKSNQVSYFNKGNLIVHTVKIKGRTPHTIQPNMHVCKIIYDMLISNASKSLFSLIGDSLYRLVSDEYKLKSEISDLNAKFELELLSNAKKD